MAQAPSDKPTRALCILWPAFVMAGVLEMLVFALVDPAGLRWMGGVYGLKTQRFVSTTVGSDLGKGVVDITYDPAPATSTNPTTSWMADHNHNKASAVFGNNSIMFFYIQAATALILILAANTAYRRQFGAVDQPTLGRTCHAVSHHIDVPCDQAGEHCPMKRAFDTKAPDRVLHIHHTPRGPEHVDVELRPILDAQREVVAYVERLATVRSASARPSSDGLVGRAPAFNTALSAVQRVAPSMLPVLLQCPLSEALKTLHLPREAVLALTGAGIGIALEQGLLP